MSNPLVEYTVQPNNTPPFSNITPEHFKSGIEQLILQAKKEVEEVKKLGKPSFEAIRQLEFAGKRLDRASSLFFNLNSAETNDEIQALAREISPMLTEFSNDILLDDGLFQIIKEVKDTISENELTEEERTLLEKTYKGFVRNGALLNEEQKDQLRRIDVELAQKSLQFGENVLAETNNYLMILDCESDLEGLPDSTKNQAAEAAKEKGYEGKWAITLDYPSYVPFMTYAKNRELRKELFLAFGSKAFKNDDLDNQQIVKDIVNLRYQRAQLLGYNTHAHFILEERMAESPQKVMRFLKELEKYGKLGAKKDVEQVARFAQELDDVKTLERWDFSYYSEKLKMEKYAIDDELLKPYFQLEKVIDGVFKTAKILLISALLKTQILTNTTPR